MIEDRKDSDGKWVKSIWKDRVSFKTKSATVWYNMVGRCKPFGPYQQRNPSYIGCYMSENFKDFQKFTSWHVNQIGYGLEDYDLDKDILVPGNKIYSEEFCVLIPHKLNSFFRSSRGDMAGVFFDDRRNQIYSNIVTMEGQKRLDNFSSVEAASKAYKKAKRIEATKWVGLIDSGEICVDPRVKARLENW